MNKPVGYSTKTVAQKLGYQAGDRVYTRNAPRWFATYLLREGIDVVDAPPAAWAHIFATSYSACERELRDLKLDDITKALWVSWPKKTSGQATDLTENRIRDLVLNLGWVDIKVCAIDETWSGLKFTRRRPLE